MENAGAEEFAQIEDVERKGLGTPATRAGVIEKLVKGGFVERKNKLLIPTKKGMELINVLPDAVKSAKLTADWEEALKEVERGERKPEEFMDGITRMVCGLVESSMETVTHAFSALIAIFVTSTLPIQQFFSLASTSHDIFSANTQLSVPSYT